MENQGFFLSAKFRQNVKNESVSAKHCQISNQKQKSLKTFAHIWTLILIW
jgi:hypothetical protein